ncbi:MAG: glycosyltransferase family 4 protein [Terriglobales bacterium]
MHVLLTTDTVGGVWTYTQELATGLLARGTRVTMLSFGPPPRREQAEWMHRLSLDCRTARFPLEWMQEAPSALDAARDWVRQQARELAPDLLHSNQFAFASLASELPTIVTAHSDLFSWWRAVHGSRPPETPFYALYGDIACNALVTAHAVVTPSAVAADDLRRSFGYWGPITVIPNGRDPRRFHPQRHKRDVVLSVGRLWDPAKQFELLASVAAALPVRLAGSRCPPGTRTPTPGVRGTTYLGNLGARQLASEMAQARLYLATSCYEPFGLAPLEAALSGCALLLADIPSFREVWGEAAAYFTPRCATNLARELQRLTFDLPACVRLATAGYQHALNHYTAARMVSEYLKLYRGVLTGAGRATRPDDNTTHAGQRWDRKPEAA